jgi:threonyl-tRNA synthetase
VVIVPVSTDKHLDFAKTVGEDLKKLGIRARVDERNETMGYKTRQIQTAKIPFMLVVGDKEMEANSLSVRAYGAATSQTMSIVDLKEKLIELNKDNTPAKLR